MLFDYLERVVVEGQLDVDNIGECVLQANNDFGQEYYLIITTQLGETQLLEYGPIFPDIELLPDSYQIKYSRFEYSQGKIEKAIDKFLNDGKRMITQAKVVSLDDIASCLVNPIDRVHING